MSKQNYLLELINTLNTNEKRYFKLFSTLQPGEKRYLKLFDALDGKQNYNITELCKETGLTAKQLTDDKYYLTQALLQSLQNFDKTGNGLGMLQNNKENARALIVRRQFAFALDIVERCLERAWELEAFELIPELLTMKMKCEFGINRFIVEFTIQQPYAEVNSKMEEFYEIQTLGNTARKIHSEANKILEYEALLNHKLLANGVDALSSLRSKLIYYEIWINYYIGSHKRSMAAKLQRQEQELYRNHIVLKILSPIGYVQNTLIMSSNETSAGNHQLACEMLDALEYELDKGDLDLTLQQVQSLKLNAVSFKLWPLRHLGRYSDAVKEARSIYDKVQGRSDTDRFVMMFEYALSLLLSGNATQALTIVDELLRIKSTVRTDMQPYLRIISLMVQMSLGNYAVIPYQVKSTKAWFKKQNISNNEFDLFFKHILGIAQSADRRAAWRGLNSDILDGKLLNTNALIQVGHWSITQLSKGKF